MSITRELVENVRRRVAETPGVLTAQLANEFGASEAEVVTALPLHMRLRARLEAFDDIWGVIENWQDVSLYGNGALSMGCLDHSYGFPALSYTENNIHLQCGDYLHKGMLNPDELGFIWFVSKPLCAAESHSVQFFDKAGEHLLSVYLGRDEKGEIDEKAKQDFEDLRVRHGVKPVPHNRCKGCGNCTCGHGQKKH